MRALSARCVRLRAASARLGRVAEHALRACAAWRALSTAQSACAKMCTRQSPIPADRRPENKGKTPRIVKWKMDRLF